MAEPPTEPAEIGHEVIRSSSEKIANCNKTGDVANTNTSPVNVAAEKTTSVSSTVHEERANDETKDERPKNKKKHRGKDKSSKEKIQKINLIGSSSSDSETPAPPSSSDHIDTIVFETARRKLEPFDPKTKTHSISQDSKNRKKHMQKKAKKKQFLKAKAKSRKPKHSNKSSDDSTSSEVESVEFENDGMAASLGVDQKALQKVLAGLLLQKHAVDSRPQPEEGCIDQQPDRVSGKSPARKNLLSEIAFKRVDQIWDSTTHNFKLTETANDPDAGNWEQYIFTVRRNFNWENQYLETVVEIRSKCLRDALGEILDGVKGVSLVQEPAAIDPNMLFLYLEETRQHMKGLKEKARLEERKLRKAAVTKAAHLELLIGYLDTDYADVKKMLIPLLEANTITFDLLWALYKPNTIVYTTTYENQDEPRAFKIEYAQKESSFPRGQWYNVEGRYLEYDGKSFGFGAITSEVEFFKGARKITSLACYPLQYHRDADTLRARLIERGKRFVALQGMNYCFYKGMAFYKKKSPVAIKVNIEGRIVIDPATHRRINPNYPVGTFPSGNAESFDAPDARTSDGLRFDSENRHLSDGFNSDINEGSSPVTLHGQCKWIQDAEKTAHLVATEFDEDCDEAQREKFDRLEGDSANDPEDRHFADEELLITSSVVFGFSFNEKLWLEFTVSGVSDIKWNAEAFESLVLPEDHKTIVKALVESHTFHAAENIDDVVQGKGKGLVAVLHGPPGTGKTLTAEGIADLLKRPLYMVSAGELGTDPHTLEAELNKILDVAHSWGAVLLLDEADVFLERRTTHDIHRNALVSIFLRLLEYFQGILFLTTNRVEAFDDAFQSRIHVALRYEDLTVEAKRRVWKIFLDRVRTIGGAKVADFTKADYNVLARHTLNGRQIKNSVRTAQALAVSEGNALSMSHIERVLEVAKAFDQDLRGGSGYLDAMRSYT